MTVRRSPMRRLLLAAVAAVASFTAASGVAQATPSGCTVTKATYSIVAYCSSGTGNYRVAGYCTNGSTYLYVTGPWRTEGTTASIKTCPGSYPNASSAWLDY